MDSIKQLITKINELDECVSATTAALAPYPVMPVGTVVTKKKKDDREKKHNNRDIQ